MNQVRVRRPRYFISDFQEEMNRMLQDAFEDIGIIQAKTDGQQMMWKPAVELVEQNGNFQVKAQLPGVKKEDIDIEVSEDSITIRAETRQKEEEKGENIYRSEFRYGQFMRTIPFPTEVQSSDAKAEYNEGILTVTVPKTQEQKEKTRKLKIE